MKIKVLFLKWQKELNNYNSQIDRFERIIKEYSNEKKELDRKVRVETDLNSKLEKTLDSIPCICVNWDENDIISKYSQNDTGHRYSVLKV